MPVTIEWNDASMEVLAEFDADSVPESWVTELRRLLVDFVAASGITGLEVARVGAGPLYDYSFTDGSRNWDQSLDSTNSSDPSMTFDVPDYWDLSEFAPQRPLRNWVVDGIHNYQLSGLEVSIL